MSRLTRSIFIGLSLLCHMFQTQLHLPCPVLRLMTATSTVTPGIQEEKMSVSILDLPGLQAPAFAECKPSFDKHQLCQNCGQHLDEALEELNMPPTRGKANTCRERHRLSDETVPVAQKGRTGDQNIDHLRRRLPVGYGHFINL